MLSVNQALPAFYVFAAGQASHPLVSSYIYPVASYNLHPAFTFTSILVYIFASETTNITKDDARQIIFRFTNYTR